MGSRQPRRAVWGKAHMGGLFSLPPAIALREPVPAPPFTSLGLGCAWANSRPQHRTPAVARGWENRWSSLISIRPCCALPLQSPRPGHCSGKASLPNAASHQAGVGFWSVEVTDPWVPWTRTLHPLSWRGPYRWAHHLSLYLSDIPTGSELTGQNNKTLEEYDRFKRKITCWKYIFQRSRNVKTDEPGILN